MRLLQVFADIFGQSAHAVDITSELVVIPAEYLDVRDRNVHVAFDAGSVTAKRFRPKSQEAGARVVFKPFDHDGGAAAYDIGRNILLFDEGRRSFACLSRFVQKCGIIMAPYVGGIL